jgi:hypothetical protein
MARNSPVVHRARQPVLQLPLALVPHVCQPKRLAKVASYLVLHLKELLELKIILNHKVPPAFQVVNEWTLAISLGIALGVRQKVSAVL